MGVLIEVEEAKHERLRPSNQVPPSVLKWEKIDIVTVRNPTIVVVGVGV
jgi:hypothetical protein